MSHRYDSSYRESLHTQLKQNNIQYTAQAQQNNVSGLELAYIISGLMNAAMQIPMTSAQTNQQQVQEQPQAEKKEDIEAKVESLGFKKNSEYFKDIVKKYDAMKAVNPKISDSEALRRLTNYTDALERQKQQQKIIDADLNDPKTLEMEVVDKNMTPEVIKDQDAYIRALYNRGEGELAIYDINGDNQVTEEEFIKTETGKTKEELLKTDEGAIQLEAALKSFMKYNVDRNKVLTTDELGAASYASYRLSDFDENGKEISKTGNSMGVDEYVATVAILSGATEPNDPDRKNFTDLQLGAYGMLKNYKP